MEAQKGSYNFVEQRNLISHNREKNMESDEEKDEYVSLFIYKFNPLNRPFLIS